jgi:uncharacterized protein YkwD
MTAAGRRREGSAGQRRMGLRGMQGMRFIAPSLLVAAAFAAVSSAQAPAASESRPAVRTAPLTGLDGEILARMNAIRAERGLVRLAPSSALATAAEDHSTQMAVIGRFQHQSVDGSPFWQRIEHFYPAAGFSRWAVGEMLFWSSPRASVTSTVGDWLASSPHRKVLLDPKWREVGIAALYAPGAPGDFHGRAVTIVTADFGVRAR